MKSYYNRGSKYQKDLHNGENIFIKDGNIWKRGVVVRKHDTPRSYIVQGEGGTSRFKFDELLR